MESYKRNIIDALINGGINNKTLLKIDDAIQWAWNHWNKELIDTYYSGDKKPELPTTEFIEEWVENEDFEADDYDVEYLKELFA